jgi:hypothetical protein
VRWQRINPAGLKLDASRWFVGFDNRPKEAGGLADGASAEAVIGRSRPTTSATITAAVFSDGEFRGADTADPIHNIVEVTFQLIREAHTMAHAGEWDKVQAKADKAEDGLLSSMAAQKFLKARGDDKAMAALDYLGNLPASTWKADPLINRIPGLQLIAEWFSPMFLLDNRSRVHLSRWLRGHKTGGRTAGTPNRKTQEISALLESLGCNPIEGMARIATNEAHSPELRGRMYAELAQYVYPKRKAVELATDLVIPQQPKLVVEFARARPCEPTDRPSHGPVWIRGISAVSMRRAWPGTSFCR